MGGSSIDIQKKGVVLKEVLPQAIAIFRGFQLVEGAPALRPSCPLQKETIDALP